MTSRPPWLPSESFEQPSFIHQGARALGDDPEQEWSFPLLADRLLALEESGLNFGYEPLSTWDETCAALQLKAALEQAGIGSPLGYSLTIGFGVYDSSLRSTTGLLRVPTPDEVFRGRHLVALLEYDETRDLLVFANSWGERWGEGGIGYLTRDYYELYADDVTLRRSTWVGPSPAMDTALREAAWRQGTPGAYDARLWRRCWMAGNRPQAKVVLVGGRPHKVVRRMLSTFAGLPFDVVELREGDRLKGRLHLVHDRAQGVSTAWEFWVPKEVRRLGYGTALLTVARELAGFVRTNRIAIVLHEADATDLGRTRAKAFAASVGGRLTALDSRRPVVRGRLETSLQ